MRTIECVMDSNSNANRGRSQSFNRLLRFPEVWNPTLSCVRAGFRNRLYEGNDHTAEASTPRQCRALGGTLRTPSATLRNVIPLCRTGQLLDCRPTGN